MKSTLALWFLLWPCLAYGQIPGAVAVGQRISPSKVQEIEERHKADGETLDRLRARDTIQLEVGEFDVIQALDSNGKPVDTGPVLWLSIDTSIVSKTDIAAGERGMIFGKRRGEKAAKWHTFEKQPFRYWFLMADKQGRTPLVLVQNGAPDPPKVIDRLDAVVGKPIPVPVDPIDPPPSNDPLVLAAKADVARGAGTADDVKFYREYLLTVANSLPGVLFKTNFEFLDAFDDVIEARLGEAKTPSARLLGMRRLIAEEFNKTLPRNSVEFNATVRAQYGDAFRKVAERLKGYQ